MTETEFSDRLTGIFKTVLDLKTIDLQPETTADDIEEWDSLSHLQLIVTIEKQFNIKFTSYDIQKMNNVGDLITVIRQKLQLK